MISKIKDYVKTHKRWLMIFLPEVIPLIGMAIVLIYIVIRGSTDVAAKLFFALFVLWVVTAIWYLYVWTLANKLGFENLQRGVNSYLNGTDFWYYESGGFMELGRQMGHGLCYEAAAMLMLVWRDHEKTRFVCGEAYSDLYHDMVPHAWMEIKAYGIWWVFDAAWYSPTHAVPRLWYLFRERAKVCEVVEHREFFSHKNARVLTEAIRKPDTSQCLHKLSSFSRNLAPSN